MANFITTLIKSTLTLITYHSIIFTIEDMLNVLVLSQTTNINKIARKNFLDFQTLTILNFTLLDNLLIYG